MSFVLHFVFQRNREVLKIPASVRLETETETLLLKTAEATIEVIAEPNGVIGGMRSFAGLGEILLIKDDEILLRMNATAARQQLEHTQVLFFARPQLHLKDVSFNKPISEIAQAETAVIWFEKLPPHSKIVRGDIVLVFNGSVSVTIPVPPQLMRHGDIVIEDVQKYFTKRGR